MVSVIIPTHNRQTYLRLALDALAWQTYPYDRFEVVIVLDGCTDGSLEMLRNYRPPYRLCVFEQEQKGASATRNQGARMATGNLLIFLDDDVEATPNLIQAHVKAHSAASQRVVIGYYPPALAGQKDLLALELQSWWEEIFLSMQEFGHRFCYADLLSGNFSIPREIYDTVGGFNTNLPMREDYELGMRLIQANMTLIFEPEAIGLHHDQAVIQKSTRRKYVEGIADIRLGQLYPELIPTLLIWRLLKFSFLPSRLLQHLELHSPRLANWLASKAERMLPRLEKAHLVGVWRRVLYGLLVYWYWKGVVQELPTWRDIRHFLAEEANTRYTHRKPELSLDLSLGLDQAEQVLDRERPESVVLYYGDKFLGYLPYQPGAERWRGAHLRPHLIHHSLFQLLETYASQGIINLPVNIEEIAAFTQNDILL